MNMIGDQEFYKESYANLQNTADRIISVVDALSDGSKNNCLWDHVEHCKYRIKSADSIKRKLEKLGFEVTVENALTKIYDAVGIRIVCTFADDVYLLSNLILQQRDIDVIQCKDYIKNPKPNGYRSYHMIVQTRGIYAEIQIRTIAMDCWASLEHQLKYKKNINNEMMIVAELKRCADEIASTDINLQTIRDLIE